MSSISPRGDLRNRLRIMSEPVLRFADQVTELVFRPSDEAVPRPLTIVGIAGLYLLGLAAWYYFLNGGDIQLELHDWAEVTAPRYAFLQDAARKGELPLHMPGKWALRNVTDRFASVADTNLSPQVLLLRFMEVGDFILANTLILYTLGFVGLLLLRDRLRLSMGAFTLLYALLFFNGSISTHLAVGHANWPAYFLIPFLIVLVLELLDQPKMWRWIGWYSAWMLLIFLQGAFHLFAATLLFMILVAIFYPQQRVTAVLGMVFALLSSSVRILPAALEASKFDTEFLSGFTDLEELFQAMVTLRPLQESTIFSNTMLSRLGWWEKDYYLGVAGLAFLVFMVFILWTHERDLLKRYSPLLWPLLLLAVLSIGRFYRIIAVLQIPLFSSQRVSTRLFALPLAIVIAIAVHAFQRSTDRWRAIRQLRALAIIGMAIMAHDLWQHFKTWRVIHMSSLFQPKPLDLSLNYVANHADPAYTTMLALGAVLSVCSLGFVTYKARSRR